MPKRKEFEHEYDNEAELILHDMEFFDNETEDDRQLKFQVLDLYNARLDERIKRKKFVIERELLDIKSCLLYTSPSPRDS